MSEPKQLTYARSVLQAQPFSVLLGTEILAFGPALTELRLALRPELKQQHGFAHGGVLSYLADNALTFAGGSALSDAVVTAEYKINYVRPAQGDTLLARARVLHGGKRQAVCACEIFAIDAEGGEKLVAVAQGTISAMGERPAV